MTPLQTKRCDPTAPARTARSIRRRALAVCAGLIVVLSLAASATVAVTRINAQSATATPSSVYVVQPGDSWTSLSLKTGISIRELQAANPQAVRPTGWLIVGEELQLPNATPTEPAPMTPTATPVGEAEATGTATATVTETVTVTEAVTVTETPAAEEEQATGAQTYVVQAGESWNSIAQKFGVSAEALRAANPSAVRPGLVLFRNEQLIIPAQPGATAPAATALAATAPATVETATAAATEPTPAATPEPDASPAPAEEVASACPEAFADYPTSIEARVAESNDIEAVLEFLRTCEVMSEEDLRSGDWNGDGVDDWALVLQNANSDSARPETELLVLMSDGDGFKLTYQARPAGQVSMLAADDINLDGQPDLVWVDTTCGASTCFDTTMVRSWDGSAWVDWSESAIVMAYAEVKLDDVRDIAEGREIVLLGGEYGSVGAGPQRSRTEVWGSVEGAPYRLLDTVYERSNCLYFKVLDANEALTRYSEIGLVQAREMYNEAVTNRNLVKCGQRSDELSELRSFSLFRLALIYAYEGNAELAAETVAQLQDAFPASPFADMAAEWLGVYTAEGDIAAACAAATAYAEANPEGHTALSDYGYANPTFTAADLCPVLDIEVGVDSGEATSETAAPAVAESEPITPLLTLTATTDLAAVAPSTIGQAGELPDCPTTLDEYSAVLPAVIALSEGDALIVETWLRLCDGMTDERGGMLLADFNADGIEDAIFLPTIVSDLGFGPGGAQGAVLIYHGVGDGDYELAYAPDVYGQPTLLAVDDLNGDQYVELAWTIEGCSTFCVKEVQIVRWDEQKRDYISIIEPGATIAEGSATFVELPAGAPGQGQQLVLSGGVSGTTDGGLKIEHDETWQSVDGRPFRRLSWTYDRENSSSDCVGLRLIEADVALHAADILGYDTAIDLYRAALDPALNACSIHGVPAPEELKLLQGLATFRLIQAQALAGDRDAAAADLAALRQGQPDSAYSRAADQWLAAYADRGDAVAACLLLQPLFDEETLTWQITDHFGYNHPALAPEQVCFVPRDK
jgi:LysM repeat protein/tetratricopeptide (TPR) repeat protein